MIKNITFQDKSKYLPALYIISTPIGNLKDITIRALETLNSVDIVYCEDTRNSRILLEKYGIATKTSSYHEHNAEQVRPRIISEILNGKAIGLISDAGTPLISDPGYKLVKECIEHKIVIYPIPGPCAAIAGLTIAGCPPDRFHFVGFPPNKSNARAEFFHELKNLRGSIIFYESPKRLADTLLTIQNTVGDIQICVARELTKKFEEKIYGQVTEVIEQIEGHELKGEVVVIINNPEVVEQHVSEYEPLIRELLQYCSVKDISQIMANVFKMKKSEIYDLTLRLKHGS